MNFMPETLCTCQTRVTWLTCQTRRIGPCSIRGQRVPTVGYVCVNAAQRGSQVGRRTTGRHSPHLRLAQR